MVTTSLLWTPTQKCTSWHVAAGTRADCAQSGQQEFMKPKRSRGVLHAKWVAANPCVRLTFKI